MMQQPGPVKYTWMNNQHFKSNAKTIQCGTSTQVRSLSTLWRNLFAISSPVVFVNISHCLNNLPTLSWHYRWKLMHDHRNNIPRLRSRVRPSVFKVRETNRLELVVGVEYFFLWMGKKSWRTFSRGARESHIRTKHKNPHIWQLQCSYITWQFWPLAIQI